MCKMNVTEDLLDFCTSTSLFYSLTNDWKIFTKEEILPVSLPSMSQFQHPELDNTKKMHLDQSADLSAIPHPPYNGALLWYAQVGSLASAN